jgi:hypothetical protein
VAARKEFGNELHPWNRIREYKLRLEGYEIKEALHCKIRNDSNADDNDQNVFVEVTGVRILNQLTQ